MPVEGVEKVTNRFNQLRLQVGDAKAGAVVGYTQPYAIYVHENLEAKHAEGKQAKFLEAPARRLAPTLGRIVREVYAETKDLSKAVLASALRLLRESQQIVPIDTGALKASGFAALAKDVSLEASLAFMRGQEVQQAALSKRKQKRLVKSKKRGK